MLQKKAVRILTHSNFLDHTSPLFKKLEILTISQIYELNSLSFIYRCFKCNQHNEFKNRISANSDIHSHNTRERNYRVIIRARLEICRNSFLYHGTQAWNKLESNIKRLNSIGYLKK